MKIGIWNTAFLGDTLLTLPLIYNILSVYSDAEIDFWVRTQYVALYATQERFCIKGYDKTKDGTVRGLYTLGKHIAKKKYDIWINPHPSWRSSYIMYAAEAKSTVAYTIPYINKYIATNAVKRAQDIHEVFRLLRLMESYGISQELSLPVYCTDIVRKNTVHQYWNQVAQQRGIPCEELKILALAIGALWPTKRWPAPYYGQLAMLAMDAGMEIVLVGGGAEEVALANTIVSAVPKTKRAHIHNYLNASLADTAAVLASATVCCGGDTGLTHLAWLQNIPTIMLYGPTTEEQGFSPLSDSSVALGVPLPCRPCGKHGHPTCPKGHFLCMRELQPQMVWRYVQERI